MDLAGWSGTGGDPVPAVRGGIVSRRGLFGRLGTAGRVTEVSAPAGSGKTFLLRSWIGEAGLAGRVAWVPVPPQERDARRFWLSVLDALRGTAPGSALVREVTAAPGLDTGDIVEGLLADLGSLEDRIWLVVDDVHELCSAEVLRQLELLVMRAPQGLRFVLVTRHDLRLGLHRLRLEGGLTEIRAADLRFTVEEARELFAAAGVELPDAVLALLVDRAEGWAAGLRLAALSLAGHPDPARFAEEFSGSERTVAEYLLAEVLERQSEEVRQVLLRTSVLERVSGPLVDVLTGRSGGERVLQELEAVNAFVVSLDARRSWFRYHHLFADLLQLELRRTDPGGLPAVHRAAAGWFAEHGFPVEAVRHAQAAGDWGLAARQLFDTWLSLTLDGQQDTAHELLAGFPPGVIATDPELIALAAADELNHGSLEHAEGHLARAARELASVPAERRVRFQVALGISRLSLARQRGDLPTVAKEAQRLLAPAGAADSAELGMSGDLRALALISLGIAETWAARPEDADRHLEQGVALGRRIGRPYLELLGLAHGAVVAALRSWALGEQRSRQAIELARWHGWGEDQAVNVAYTELAGMTIGQGRLDEAEPWLERAERTLRAGVEPAAEMSLHFARWTFDMSRGRHADALADIQAAERLAGTLVTPPTSATSIRARMLLTLLRMDQTERVEAALAGLDEKESRSAEMCIALASLRLTQHDPKAATTALAPILDGSVPAFPAAWMVGALLQEAMARDALGDQSAAGGALERALDLAEPDRVLIPFLLVSPAPGLLESHARRRIAHAGLITEILHLLAPGRYRGAGSPSQGGSGGMGPPGKDSGGIPGGRPPGEMLREPLTQAETRVLRYLPTQLSVPEIAGELYLSVSTIRTHIRHLYDKLDARHRTGAVERARALGLLAPSSRGT